MRDFRTLIADRVYLGAVLNQGFLYAALFAYLAGATYVLQDDLRAVAAGVCGGIRPQLGRVHGLRISEGRSSDRRSIPGTLTIGILVAGIGAAG